jgi:hypothetical protein
MNQHRSSIDALADKCDIIRQAKICGIAIPADFDRQFGYTKRQVLVNAARHIVGGYKNDSPEERAVDMLLRIAQEIPL